MTEEREIVAPEPVFEDPLHPDVIEECRRAFALGRPWTEIRVLRSDTDGPAEAHRCGGGPGTFHLTCPKPVEGIQYSSARGCPLYFCEEHALQQLEADRNMYDLPPREVPDLTPEEKAEIQRMLQKGKKRRAEPEEQEFEP